MAAPLRPQRHSVPPDQVTTTFPLATMTDQQREVFTAFLTARRKSRLNVQEPISVARLLVRHKPGVELTPLRMPSIVDYTPLITAEAIPQAFDLEYETTKHDIITMARTSWRLDLLSQTDEWSDAGPRRTGVFLGYPEADIDHYLYSEPPNVSSETYIKRGVFSSEDLAFAKFIPQRHDDSIDGYARAIRTGKEIWTILSRYAIHWDLPQLQQYMEWLYRSALKKFAGNKLEYEWI